MLVSVGRDARAARDATKQVLAYYLHRVETVVTAESGADPEEVARVKQAVLDGGVPAGAELISDALIDVFAAAGDPDAVAEQLGAWIDAGLRGILAWHVLGPDKDEALQLLGEQVAPQLRDLDTRVAVDG